MSKFWISFEYASYSRTKFSVQYVSIFFNLASILKKNLKLAIVKK